MKQPCPDLSRSACLPSLISLSATIQLGQKLGRWFLIFFVAIHVVLEEDTEGEFQS